MVVTSSRNDDFFVPAFIISLAVHAVLLSVMIWGKEIFKDDDPPPNIIYSVTLESSNLLGGINQVPKTDKKTPIAPPKKTSASQPKGSLEDSVKEEVKGTKAKESQPEEKDSDAEVSLAEKKKEEEKKVEKKEPTKAPTKKPTPAPTPAKKPTAKPTQKPAATVSKGKGSGSSNNKGATSGMDVERGYQQAMQRYLGASTNAGGQGFGGDGRGGSGMGGGVLRPPAWFIYKESLEAHVRKGWNWYQPNSRLRATVTFRISPSGVVSDVRISESSGNAQYDQSILRAVNKASPVPVPPSAFYNDFSFVSIDFTPEI